MGYHLILNSSSEEIKSIYIKELKELLNIPNLSKDCIIYQGEEHWKPLKLKEKEEYENYTKDWYRAGLNAQTLFKRQAQAKGFILEEINQDSESFKSYIVNAKSHIKRGDCIVRNAGNVEVEVKCRKFYGATHAPFFFFSLSDFNGHKTMMECTGQDVIVALYEREDDHPIEESLRMINLKDILCNKSAYKTQHHPDPTVGKAYKIPISDTKIGFELLLQLKKR